MKAALPPVSPQCQNCGAPLERQPTYQAPMPEKIVLVHPAEGLQSCPYVNKRFWISLETVELEEVPRMTVDTYEDVRWTEDKAPVGADLVIARHTSGEYMYSKELEKIADARIDPFREFRQFKADPGGRKYLGTWKPKE